jgi:hypothetical protein
MKALAVKSCSNLLHNWGALQLVSTLRDILLPQSQNAKGN